MFDLAVRNGRVYQNGAFIEANLYIRDGKIAEITPAFLDAKEEYDASGRMVLPGFIDPHVHFSMPAGRYSTADTFETGSVAGAFGGITTYIDFLECAPDAAGIRREFEARMALVRGSVTDYAFHASVAEPTDDARELVRAAKTLGMPTIKVYTTYKESSSYTSDADIDALLAISAEERVRILVHAEQDDLLCKDGVPVAHHEEARPAAAETAQVLRLAKMAKQNGGNLYIVHVSAGETIERLKAVFPELLGRQILLESCPHYFRFTRAVYKQPDGCLYTMAPPLRSEEQRQLLVENWSSIDTIGTDHCTFFKRDKQKADTANIPMGVGGVEVSFCVMYSLFGDSAIDRFTVRPAKAHGLYPQKGALLPGADADVVVFDPDVETVAGSGHSACDYSLYTGMRFRGKVCSTLVRGRFVVKDGDLRRTVGQFVRAAL